ncbi:MAG: DUF3572 domain-containing protein [Alphaproteobacteria bacterium]
MNQDQAEMTGIKALGWLAGQDDLLTRFLGMTGIEAGDIRTRAQDPEFLGFVLDFLLTEDQLVLDFCEASGLATEAPMHARMALPGGNIPNWT